MLRWVSLHGPNSISCGLLIFSSLFLFTFSSPSPLPFSLPSFFFFCYGIARERGTCAKEKGGIK